MPQPLLAETIQRHWRQILTLLGESQPECGEDVYGGATGQYLVQLERFMGQPLPEELKALYRLNNGQGRLGSGFSIQMFSGGIFEGYYFLPLGGVAQIWQQLCLQPHATATGAPGWIPFARDRQGKMVLCLDMRQLEGEQPGRVIEASTETGSFQVLAPNLLNYLEQLVRQILWLKRQRSGRTPRAAIPQKVALPVG